MIHARNKPNQQILDEAAGWFVDFREGALSVEAQQAFSQWLRSVARQESLALSSAGWNDLRHRRMC